MKKIIFSILLIVGTHSLFAQYLHYWDNSRPRRYSQAVETPPPPVEDKPVEVKKPEVKEVPLPLTAPLKIEANILIASTNIPFNTVAGPPKFDRPPMIFHDWPDKCPGLTGAVPVLLNYVPPEIVLMVTEKYKGHLYSITTNKGTDNKPEYKLKVCKNGMIRYEYANYKGEIIVDREE